MTWFFLTLLMWPAGGPSGPPARPEVVLRLYYTTAGACEAARQSILATGMMRAGIDARARGFSLLICQPERIE